MVAALASLSESPSGDCCYQKLNQKLILSLGSHEKEMEKEGEALRRRPNHPKVVQIHHLMTRVKLARKSGRPLHQKTNFRDFYHRGGIIN